MGGVSLFPSALVPLPQRTNVDLKSHPEQVAFTGVRICYLVAASFRVYGQSGNFMKMESLKPNALGTGF